LTEAKRLSSALSAVKSLFVAAFVSSSFFSFLFFGDG
jgi:hypothetical protein